MQLKYKSASGSLLFSHRRRTSTWWRASRIIVLSTRIDNCSRRSVFISQRPSFSSYQPWYSAFSMLSWLSVCTRQDWSIKFDGQRVKQWTRVPCDWIHRRWTLIYHSTVDGHAMHRLPPRCYRVYRSYVKETFRLRVWLYTCSRWRNQHLKCSVSVLIDRLFESDASDIRDFDVNRIRTTESLVSFVLI